MSRNGRGRALALLLRLVLLVVFFEGSSYIALSIIKRQMVTYGVLDAAREIQIRAGAAASPAQMIEGLHTTLEAPHPFLGFTFDPRYDPPGVLAQYKLPVSDWGFLDDKPPVQPASSDTVVIGLFGGSVAHWTFLNDALRDSLAATHAFQGKRLMFVRTAIPGLKQPQQLMALTYLLALGAHFDAIINLDGFNEVALPLSDNLAQGFFPFFPRNWPTLLGDGGGTARERLIGEITFLRYRRGRQAQLFSWPVLCRSWSANLAWTLLDRWTAGEFDVLQAALESQPPDAAARSYAAVGPARTYANDAALQQDLADVWMRSSLEMHRLCAAAHIRYFHFLQPNQYFPGSKPMGRAEARLALYPGTAYERGVRGGYPRLIENGRLLAQQGVDFVDLTQIFAGIEAPLYADNCCHLNDDGSERLARRIGTHVREAIDREPAAR